MLYYDSDDEIEVDDYQMMLAGIYGFNHGFFHDGWPAWDSDYSDYGGFDYDTDYSSYSGASSVTSNDLEGFPDYKKFSTEIIHRIRSFENISYIYSMPPSTLDNHALENLWENLQYLRDLTDIGAHRIISPLPENYTNESSKNVKLIYDKSVEYFKEIPAELLGMMNDWVIWCNDLFIDMLQKLIPVALPFTVWENIMKCLSTSEWSSCKTLKCKLNVLSETEELQMIEREFIKICTNQCVEINKMLYHVLYFGITVHSMGKLKLEPQLKLQQTLMRFNTQLGKLCSYLQTVDPSINHPHESKLLFYVENTPEFDLLEVTDYEFDLESINLTKVFRANSNFQYPSSYFSFVVKSDCHNCDENTYYIIALDMHDPSIKKKFFRRCFESLNFETLYSSGNYACYIYAPIKVDDQCTTILPSTLALWDLSSSQQSPHKYELLNFENHIATLFKRENIKISHIHNVGFTKPEGDSIKIFVSIHYISEKTGHEVDEKVRFTHVLDVNTATSDPPTLTMNFSDADLVGCYKFTIFIVEYTPANDPVLCAYDISAGKENCKLLTKICWDEKNMWNLRFNCSPSGDTLLLYRNNELQIRKLDSELTFVKDIHIGISSSPLMTKPFFQLYDDVLFGYRVSDCDAMPMIEENFVADINDKDPELVYFNLGDRYEQEEFKLQWISFDKDGNIVKMEMFADEETLHDDHENCSEYFSCCAIELTKYEFKNSFKDVIEDKLPPAREMIQAIKEREKREEEQRQHEEEQRKEVAARRAREEESRREQAAKSLQEMREKTAADEEKLTKRKRALQQLIDKGDIFYASLTRWINHRHFGFAKITVEGENQDVYVPWRSFNMRGIRNTPRHCVRKGTNISFNLKWDVGQPRPKAINVAVLSVMD